MKKKLLNTLLLIIVLLVISIFIIPRENFTVTSPGALVQFMNYELPKIIWCYWHSDDMPEQIRQIQENNKRKLIGWTIVIVTNSTKQKYVGNDDRKIIKKKLSPEYYSDWLRLYLLKKYGGTWMDISIIINNENQFNNLWSESIMNKYELVGFNGSHLERDTIEHPVIENWFIMAPKNSEIISLWFEEYEKAIEMGFLEYKNQSIKNGIDYQNIFSDEPSQVYLTQDGCLQVVLQKRLGRKANIYYQNAMETMFKVQSNCSWDKKCLQEKLNNNLYSKITPYIKLTGADRKDLDLRNYFQ